MVVWGSETARMMRCVCSSRPSRNRLCTLATTKSKRSSTAAGVEGAVREDVGLDSLLAHGLQRRVRAGPVQLGDNVRDRLADAGDFAQPILRDDVLQRLAEREQVFGGPCVGAGAVGIAAAQSGALPELGQELRDCGGVEFSHLLAGVPMNRRSTPREAVWSPRREAGKGRADPALRSRGWRSGACFN